MNIERAMREAVTLYQSGNLEQALSSTVKIIQIYPSYAKAHQLVGMIFMKAGDFTQARQAYSTALDLNSTDPEILNSFGNYYKQTAQFEEALNLYEKAINLRPEYTQAKINLGELYLKNQNPVKAAELFETALIESPNNNDLKRGLLYAYKDSYQTDLALKLSQEMSKTPQLAYTIAQLQIENGNLELARAAFQTAMDEPKIAAQAFRHLIQLEWMNTGRDAAGDVINNSLKRANLTADFFITAADILQETGQVDLALKVIDDAEMRFGPNPDFDHVRANIYIEENNPDAAFELSQKILSFNPNNSIYISAFVRAALMVGEYESALTEAQRMLDIYPNNQFFIAILATSLKALGRDDEGLLDYNRLVKSYMIEVPDHYEDRGTFLAELKSELDRLHNHKNHPIGQSLRQGSQTSIDLRFASSQVIQDFFRALELPLQSYMKDIGQNDQHVLTRRNRQSYRITGAWSVRLSGKGYHVNHVHPEGWISSAFYVDVPSGTAKDPNKSGWIKFGEPPFPVKGVTAEHWVAPTPGQLVLFPSYMWHGTVPIHDDATRMTLPFDAVPL